MRPDLKSIACWQQWGAADAEARALLGRAEISTDKIPPGFDGQKLLWDLKKERLRYSISSALETPFALVADADAVLAVSKAALSLIRALDGLKDPLRGRARQKLAQALPAPEEEWCELLQMASGNSRLVLLLAEAHAVSAGARKEEKAMRALAKEGAAHPINKDEVSARMHLLAVALPAVYEKFMHKKCGVGIDGTNDRPTEGVRFVVAASEHIKLGASATAVVQAWKRSRGIGQPRDMAPEI